MSKNHLTIRAAEELLRVAGMTVDRAANKANIQAGNFYRWLDGSGGMTLRSLDSLADDLGYNVRVTFVKKRPPASLSLADANPPLPSPRCARCSSALHPTADCPFKGSPRP